MGFYKKKPVVIEAIQWTGQNLSEIEQFVGDKLKYTICDSAWKVGKGLPIILNMRIETLEGEHIVSVGDYIIKGVQGEFYPCKPDIFVSTYEPTEQLEYTELLRINGTNNYVCSHCHKTYEGMPRSMTCISCNRIFNVGDK